MKLRTGASIFLILALCCLAGPFFISGGDIAPERRLQAPSASHPMGTDTLGRDVLLRCLLAGRTSLSIGVLCVAISTTASLLLALVCMTGQLADMALMRITDALKAMPSSLLAIVLSIAFGGGMWSLVAALSLVNIPQGTRLFRGRLLTLRSMAFIEAERAIGRRKRDIILTTVIPHLLPTLALEAAFVFSSSIMAEAGLSFIGAGLAEGSASWGAMLSEGRSVIHQGWWLVLFPSIMIFLSVLSLNLIADSLRADVQ